MQRKRDWRGVHLRPSVYGRTTDALASGGDEGRGKLRKAAGRGKHPLIRRCPNGETPRPSWVGIPGREAGGGETGGSETSQYPEERKSTETARVAASESAPAQTGKHASRGCGTATRKGRGEANGLERPAVQGDSPVADSPRPSGGIPSKAGHVKPCLNPGGPPPKAKHSPMTDSEQVPRGKGEKNRC